MAVDSSIITKLSNALKAVFIQKSETSGLVKNDGTIDTTTYQEAGDYIEKSNTVGLIKNDGTVDTSTYLTEHQSLTNYVQKSQTAGLLKNDGTVDTSTYLTEHQSLADYIEKTDSDQGFLKSDGTIDSTTYQEAGNYIETSNTAGLIKNDGTIDTNTYLTEHQSLTNYVQKSQTVGLLKNDGTVDTSTYLTEHQSLSDIGGEVSVVEAQTTTNDMLKTYEITQDGTSVGTIDIPKDFLVKSGSVKTATGTSTETAAGLSTGDLYISLIVNSKDSSSNSGEELIIPAASLVDTYVADGSTLQLNTSTNTFSIKNAGVDTTQLKNEAVTSDKIASAVKSTWLTTSNVDTEIEAYLDALAEDLNPTA